MTVRSMQVRLVSMAGVPEGSIVSVKAGAMRRQAPASSGRSFRFTAEDLATGELKVDVYEKVGTGSIALVPPTAAEAPQRYKVALSESGMSCEVAVGDLESFDRPGTAAEALPPPPPPSRGVITAEESQTYLQEIGVLPFIQRVLQMVVKEKPSKPFEFIAAQMSHGHSVPKALVAVATPRAATAAPPEPSSAQAAAESNGVQIAPMFTGFACREFATGDLYEGEFVDGLRHGQGKYHFSAGDIFVGEWFNDEMHGQGRMHYGEGMYYEGQWDHGHHHGRGRYVWVKEREEYEGEFQHDELTGWGRYIHANDDVYEGEFVAGMRHGQGRLVLSDGAVAFEGQFESGKPVPGSGVSLPPGVQEVRWAPGADLVPLGLQGEKAFSDIGADGV